MARACEFRWELIYHWDENKIHGACSKLQSDSSQKWFTLCISSLIFLARSWLFNILVIGNHGSRTNIAGKKRKKKLNSDKETSVVLKISRKSENEEIQSGEFGDESKVRTIPKKKDFKKRNKLTFNPVTYNGGIKIRNKKHGSKSEMGKHTIKHVSKSLTKDRTESSDKKLEARRKRRAKGKVEYWKPNGTMWLKPKALRYQLKIMLMLHFSQKNLICSLFFQW